MNRSARKEYIGTCMKKCCIAAVLLVIAVGKAAAADLPPFAERVAKAKDIEQQEQVRLYLKEKMYPVAGPVMAEAIRMCTDHPCASTEPFAVVADVTQDGSLEHIDFEPVTDSSSCIANSLARHLRVPPPPTGDQGTLPIVIEIKITP